MAIVRSTEVNAEWRFVTRSNAAFYQEAKSCPEKKANFRYKKVEKAKGQGKEVTHWIGMWFCFWFKRAGELFLESGRAFPYISISEVN